MQNVPVGSYYLGSYLIIFQTALVLHVTSTLIYFLQSLIQLTVVPVLVEFWQMGWVLGQPQRPNGVRAA